MTNQGDRRAEIDARMEELHEAAAWRSRQLAALEYAERVASAVIADPGPTVVDGEIVYGEDGQPVPNAEIQRDAEKLLAQIRRDYTEILGEDPG